MKRLLCRLTALGIGAVFLAACTGWLDGWRPQMVDRPGGVRTSDIMDRDRNKIFDVLDRMMATAGDKELLPVIILMENTNDPMELERVAGPLEVKHSFKVIPALAAAATRDQIGALARLSFVRQVEWDAPVSVLLDGSNRWFGTEKARQDFRVNGDGDGDPARYSKADVVVAVIDTGTALRQRTYPQGGRGNA